MSKDYEIGYGKPPKAGRFKPGQSGNPKGRPKGAKSLKTIVQAQLGDKLEVKHKGKLRKVSKLEALVMKLVQDALSGNAKALHELLKLAAAYPPETEAKGVGALPVAEDDQALVEQFLARMMAKQSKDNADE
jgi:hypothetical protein